MAATGDGTETKHMIEETRRMLENTRAFLDRIRDGEEETSRYIEGLMVTLENDLRRLERERSEREKREQEMKRTDPERG